MASSCNAIMPGHCSCCDASTEIQLWDSSWSTSCNNIICSNFFHAPVPGTWPWPFCSMQVEMTTGATIHTTEGLKMTVTRRPNPPATPSLEVRTLIVEPDLIATPRADAPASVGWCASKQQALAVRVQVTIQNNKWSYVILNESFKSPSYGSLNGAGTSFRMLVGEGQSIY